MRSDDRAYFIRRAGEERAAADASDCPQAAAVHRELAERYESLADRLMPQPGRPLAAKAAGRVGSLAPLRK